MRALHIANFVAAAAVLAALSCHDVRPVISAQGLRAAVEAALPGQTTAKVPPSQCAMVSGKWFRGERGCATLNIPELEKEWMVSPNELGFHIYLGKPASWRAQVSVTAWPSERGGSETAENLALAQKILDTSVAAFARSNPSMKPAKPACEIHSPGGKAMFQALKGASEGGAMTAVFRVIADGRCALLLRAWYLDDVSWQVHSKVVDPLYDTIRVGAHVPKLPARDPGKVVEGVFRGPSRFRLNRGIEYPWIIFDRRGYVIETSPDSVKHVNLEAYYQQSPNRVGRYSVKDDEIEIVWPLGEREDKRKFEAQDNFTLKISGDSFRRMDRGYLDGKRLHGVWSTNDFRSSSYGTVETSFYSSRSYTFFDNGKFRRGSSFSVNHNDNFGNTRTHDHLPGYHSVAGGNSSEYGVYRIENDILTLEYADGAISRLPVFANSHEDLKMIYFGGEAYLKSEESPGSPPPDMPSNLRVTPPAPLLPEIYRDGFLRARGGASVMRLPALDAAQYTISFQPSPAVSQLLIFKGKDAAKTSALTMVYALPGEALRDDVRDDKAIAGDFVQRMAEGVLKDRPHLKPEGEPKEARLDGGLACSRVYSGVREGGGAEICSIIAVAENRCLVLLMTLGAGQEYSAFTRAVLTPLLGSLRVGKTVPRFEDHKPAIALSGVWCTEPDVRGEVHWLVFDPRGYLSDRAPLDECGLDLEALCLFDPALIGRYDVKGGELETLFATPRGGAKTRFLQQEGKLTIGDRVYFRVDGRQGRRAGLSGKFAARNGQNTFHFMPDGRFSTLSPGDAQAAKNAEFSRAECVEAAATPEKPSTRGCYRLDGDRLLLWYEDGRKLSRPMFFAPGPGVRIFVAGELLKLE